MMCRWNAKDYSKSSSAQLTWALELIDKLDLRGDEKVLDVGCGDGKATLEIAKRLPRGSVVGIDSAQEMIEHAKQTYPKETCPNMRFQIRDALNLNFDNAFDVIFSNATLHWVQDHLRVLQGVGKGLKKDGKLLFQMGGKGNAQDIINTVNDVIEKNKWKIYFEDFSFPYTFCSPEEYGRWLRGVGFHPKRIELIPKDMTQKGKDGLAGWIRTTWLPYTERIPENNCDQFIDDIINLYLERFPIDDNGLVHIKMMRLEVEAANP
jgi:trans-aconitate methyltransferase